MITNRIVSELKAAGLEEKGREFFNLAAEVELADKGKLKAAEAKEARTKLGQLLSNNPELSQLWGDLQKNIVGVIARDMAGEKNTKRAMIYEAAYFAQLDALGYQTATGLERLLIENIGLCWLRYLWVEHMFEGHWTKGERPIVQALYWEKVLTSAQGRYLRAVAQLARVRALATRTPTVLKVVNLPTIPTNGNGHHDNGRAAPNGHSDKIIASEAV